MTSFAGARTGDSVLIGSVETTIAIVFAIVVLGPIVAERLRVPSIVGLIAGGVIFGPSVIGWLESGGLVNQLGSIGILYLMFLAGLSFDLKSFAANRRIAIIYGLLGFFIPFLLSVVVVNRFDDVETLGALLVGAMWASNTLVAYPEVQAAGLQGNRAVGAAVAGGVVADLMSLTVMAFATATAVIEIEPSDLPFGTDVVDIISSEGVEATTSDPALPLWLGLPLLVVVCLLVLPRVASWFFVRVGHARSQRFVFTLALMGAGATMALLGGMEGLIGAFLAGLGMNRLVPARGALMERLDFVGSTLFVPVFLVSIGLTIDPALLFNLETIALGVLFSGFVLVGKTSAAMITGRVCKLSRDEVGLMSALSFGQAASTLAIAEVGSNLGMFGQDIVNAAVLTIVIIAFITSISTRYFARRIPPPDTDLTDLGEQVLLDTRPGRTNLDVLATFAGALARPDGGVVMPFGVADGDRYQEVRASVAIMADRASALGLDVDGVVRVDDSFVDATVSIVAEHRASCIVLAWDGLNWATGFLFGNDIDGVGLDAPIPCVAAHVFRPWSRVVVHTGDDPSAWHLDDAALAIDVAMRARGGDVMPLVVFGDTATFARACSAAPDNKVTFREGGEDALTALVEPSDLVVVPAHVVRALPPWRLRRLSQHLQDVNVVVVGGPHRLSFSQQAFRHHAAMPGSGGSADR